MKKLNIVWLALFIVLGVNSQPALALSGRLNINTASAKQLQELPFIGRNKAQAIVNYRHRHGPFHSPADLRRTKAIGGRTYEAIRPYITVSGASRFTGRLNSFSKAAQMRVMARITTYPGQVVMLADGAYYDTLRAFISHAAKRIDISMFLFKITKSPRNRAAIVLADLIKARKRGVMVRVLLEKSGYYPDINKYNQRVARLLRRNQIKVRFDSPRITTHTKIVVIDKRFSFIGSHNFTHSALGRNHELSILIDNRQLANQVVNYIATIH
ncbi:MAG: phospholipase [Deltaproteobacteria bacterium]|nr:phospholipase [Deltaproteobacteria bacterium]